MSWQQAGIPLEALQQAMDRCDTLGLAAFRRDCPGGFQAARGKKVVYRQRGPYEPRPLIAVAHAIAYPEAPPLGPRDFAGDSARQYLLRQHGFRLEGEAPPRRSPTITIDGTAYPLAELSRETLDGLAQLRRTDREITEIRQQLGILQTARATYMQALRDALAKRH